MSDRLLRESDVLMAIDRRIKELSVDPEFMRKNGHIDVVGVKKHILALPSADRPQGVWIDDGLDAIGAMGVEYRWHKCSQCGFRISKSPSAYYPNFCEACGAKMKGVKDE